MSPLGYHNYVNNVRQERPSQQWRDELDKYWRDTIWKKTAQYRLTWIRHCEALFRLDMSGKARYVRSQICPTQINDNKTHDMSDKARCVRQKLKQIASYVRQMCLTKIKTKCKICLTGHNYTSKRLEWLLNLLIPNIHPFYSTHNTIHMEVVAHMYLTTC